MNSTRHLLLVMFFVVDNVTIFPMVNFEHFLQGSSSKSFNA
jgi:hypothetical protein